MRRLTAILLIVALLLSLGVRAQMIGASCSDQIGDSLWIWTGSSTGAYRVLGWSVVELARYGTGGTWQVKSTVASMQSGDGPCSIAIDWDGYGPEVAGAHLFAPCAGERTYALTVTRVDLYTGVVSTLTIIAPWSFVDPMY